MLHLPNRGASSPSGQGASDFFETLGCGATQAGVDLFAAYGVELNPVLGKLRTSDVKFLSIAGFVGPQFSGFVGLGTTEGVLRRSNRTTSSPHDWMAELSNQLIGRIKNQIAGKGVLIHRVPPAVFVGDVPAMLYALVTLKPVTLTDDDDSVFLWTKFEPSITATDVWPEAETGIMAEGEMVLF
jgi:hypothetical protein